MFHDVYPMKGTSGHGRAGLLLLDIFGTADSFRSSGFISNAAANEVVLGSGVLYTVSVGSGHVSQDVMMIEELCSSVAADNEEC